MSTVLRKFKKENESLLSFVKRMADDHMKEVKSISNYSHYKVWYENEEYRRMSMVVSNLGRM